MGSARFVALTGPQRRFEYGLRSSMRSYFGAPALDSRREWALLRPVGCLRICTKACHSNAHES